MKVFGAAPHLALFENYVLVVLEEARLNYMRALPFVEVFLGEVFRQDALQPQTGQIFLPDVEEYQLKQGAEAGVLLAQNFFPKLGEVVRQHYFPAGSPRWSDLEKQLRLSLEYQMNHLVNLSCPVPETVVQLFIAALLGQNYLETGRVRLRFNFHSWRCWFYSLWGQSYEWGRFIINEKLAEANDRLYHFTEPPSLEGASIVIQPRDLLEAHGFKVVIHPNQTVEYWR